MICGSVYTVELFNRLSAVAFMLVCFVSDGLLIQTYHTVNSKRLQLADLHLL